MTNADFAHLAFLCFFDEQWRTVPSWPAYQVSNWGRVRSFWKRQGTRENLQMVVGTVGRLLKPQYRKDDGHLHVTLCTGTNTGQTTFTLGRLVLMAFDRLPVGDEEARHVYSPDPSINHLWNLAWGSPAANMRDRLRHGNNPWQKLATEEIPVIRKLLASGMNQQEIADRYGIHNSAVSMINTGKRWAHVPAS